MCATNDPNELKKMRQRKMPVYAWKVLQRRTGHPVFRIRCRTLYGPGVVKAVGVSPCSVYGTPNNRGLHVYLRRRDAEGMKLPIEQIIRVCVTPADVVAVESAGDTNRQVVACRVTIRPEDWERAGFPKRVTRTRYI